MQKFDFSFFLHAWQQKIKPFLMRTVYHPNAKRLLKFLALLGIATWSLHAFADPNSDFLAGTDTGAWATLNGTGKKYVYLIEGIVGLGAYIKTKNLLALAGIVVVAVFINIIIKIGAGQ